jgi:hypothetical protein
MDTESYVRRENYNHEYCHKLVSINGKNYTLSSEGFVFDYKGKPFNLTKGGDDYYYIDGVVVDILVAKTFIGAVGSNDVVHHLDHNKHNNTVDNLIIVPKSDYTEYITNYNMLIDQGKLTDAKLNRLIKKLIKVSRQYNVEDRVI